MAGTMPISGALSFSSPATPENGGKVLIWTVTGTKILILHRSVDLFTELTKALIV
jgi:hypothetical protein